MIKITFPDDSVKEFPKGTTGEEIAQSISPGLRKQALGIKLNGDLYDLTRPIEIDGTIAIITYRDEEGIEIMRHSTAHTMAQAIKRLYKDVNFGVGPTIEDGFYYDIDMEKSLTPEDLADIEREMKRIIDANLPIERIEVSREEAIEMFEEIGDDLKLELIADSTEEEQDTIYKQREFIDLCGCVHIPSTSKINVLNLLNISGAYWRGNRKNKQVQPIYGTVFEKQGQLDEYLQLLQERKERDHRKLGKELEIFTISQKVGQGLTM